MCESLIVRWSDEPTSNLRYNWPASGPSCEITKDLGTDIHLLHCQIIGPSCKAIPSKVVRGSGRISCIGGPSPQLLVDMGWHLIHKKDTILDQTMEANVLGAQYRENVSLMLPPNLYKQLHWGPPITSTSEVTWLENKDETISLFVTLWLHFTLARCAWDDLSLY